MKAISLFKLFIFILVIGFFAWVLFEIADKNYTPPEHEIPVTNLIFINDKDTVVVHDTIVRVKRKTKIVKICCCSHDSISCEGLNEVKLNNDLIKKD